jgi:hypothetical protein
VEEGQLPPLVKTPKDVLAPTWVEWNAHFRTDACEVQIRGEELVTVEEGEGASRRVRVAKLQLHPPGVGPLFLWEDHARAGHEAYTTIDTSAGNRESEGGCGTPREGVCGVLRSQRHRRQSTHAQQELHCMGVAGRGSRQNPCEVERPHDVAVCNGRADDGNDVPANDCGARRGCGPCPNVGGSGIRAQQQRQGLQPFRAREDSGIVQAVAGEL